MKLTFGELLRRCAISTGGTTCEYLKLPITPKVGDTVVISSKNTLRNGDYITLIVKLLEIDLSKITYEYVQNFKENPADPTFMFEYKDIFYLLCEIEIIKIIENVSTEA